MKGVEGVGEGEGKRSGSGGGRGKGESMGVGREKRFILVLSSEYQIINVPLGATVTYTLPNNNSITCSWQPNY